MCLISCVSLLRVFSWKKERKATTQTPIPMVLLRQTARRGVRFRLHDCCLTLLHYSRAAFLSDSHERATEPSAFPLGTIEQRKQAHGCCGTRSLSVCLSLSRDTLAAGVAFLLFLCFCLSPRASAFPLYLFAWEKTLPVRSRDFSCPPPSHCHRCLSDSLAV